MFTLKLENEKNNIVNINDGLKYLVLSASGLNPPSASLFTSKSPNRKGLKHNGSSLNERNIVLIIKLLGDIEQNRNALYEWIDTEQYVKVYFANGVKNVYCEGYIEECEIDTFTNNEVIELSIICGDPYWKDLNEISYEITSILKGFTFPFSIQEPIAFSTFKDDNTTTIINTGAETGAKFIIKVLDATENVVIQNAKNTGERIEINTTLNKDWIIVIDTDGSPKTIKAYLPNGTNVNLMRYLGNNTTWLTLKKGVNSFNYETGTNASDIEVSVRYSNKYLGV